MAKQTNSLIYKKYKSNIWKSYVVEFLKSLHFFSGVLVPFFTIWGGITFAQVMFLQALFTFSRFLFEIPTGTIADYLGRKTSIVIGLAINAIAALVYASTPSFWIFALGEFLWGVGGAFMSGADRALTYDSLKELKEEKKSKKIFGRLHSLHLIALLIAAPVGSIIAETISIRATMFFVFIPVAISAIIAMTMYEPKSKWHMKSKKSYAETLKEGINFFRKNKVLKIIAADISIIGTLTFFIIWSYQLVLGKLNIPILYFGFIHASLVIGQIAVSNNFARFENLAGSKKRYILISGIVAGIGFIVVAFTQNAVIAVGAMIVLTAFGMTRKILLSNYLNKHINSKVRATVLSTVSMFSSLAMAIGDIFFGIFADKNLTATLATVGILIIVTTIIIRIEEKDLRD